MSKAFALVWQLARRALSLLVVASYGALLAPWVALALAAWATRKMRALIRACLAVRYAFVRELRCKAGHRTSLIGVFECRGCGGLFAGYAFDRCPTCGESCGYVPCERCALAVRNPYL